MSQQGWCQCLPPVYSAFAWETPHRSTVPRGPGPEPGRSVWLQKTITTSLVIWPLVWSWGGGRGVESGFHLWIPFPKPLHRKYLTQFLQNPPLGLMKFCKCYRNSSLVSHPLPLCSKWTHVYMNAPCCCKMTNHLCEVANGCHACADSGPVLSGVRRIFGGKNVAASQTPHTDPSDEV